jgi:hypothetical protein
MFFRAANLAHLGRIEEAKRSAQRGLEKLALTPGGALAIAQGDVVGAIMRNNPYCRADDRDHVAEGMRKAGVPG